MISHQELRELQPLQEHEQEQGGWVEDEVFQVLLQNPSDRTDRIQEKYDQLVQRIQQMQEIKNQQEEVRRKYEEVKGELEFLVRAEREAAAEPQKKNK